MRKENLVGVHAKLRRAEQHIWQLADEMGRHCEEVSEAL